MPDNNFDVLLFNLKEAGAAAAKKASDLLEIAKLKAEAANKKGNINYIYNKMGKTVYDIYMNKEDDEAQSKLLDESCAKIDALNEEIAAIKEKVEELKKSLKTKEDGEKSEFKRTCPECESGVPDGAEFCPMCAAKL